MKLHYDFIVGFGNACSCSQILRAAGLQLLSFPFDWIVYEAEDDLCRRADMIRTDFAGWLEQKDLVFRGNVDWHNKDIYFNKATRVIFNHDIPKGSRLEDALPPAQDKYNRRIQRMFSCISSAKNVLIVRIDRPDQVPSTPKADCSTLLQALSSKFPDVHFDLLLLTMDKGRTPENLIEDTTADGITHISFDYKDPDPSSTAYAPDIPLVASMLAARYEVTDYRTPSEKRAMRKRQRLAKYRRFGATNYLQYKLAKTKARLLDDYHPRLILARLRRHKYAQIVPLGVNCEVAFRFYRSWGFLDSSLLAWAQTFNLETVCSTLRNLDRLFASKASLHGPSKMWKCEETGTYFHGQLKWGKGHRPYTDNELAADLADLRGRVGHLREKLRRYLANEAKTLIVHRLSDGDATSPDLDMRLAELETTLSNLGAKNWTLLIITEKRHLANMPAGPNRHFRAVEKFNPCDRVTDAEAGDSLGWRVIFSEFAPAKILEKKHDFKFE